LIDVLTTPNARIGRIFYSDFRIRQWNDGSGNINKKVAKLAQRSLVNGLTASTTT
jgi:hypothetical protein